MGWLSGGLLKSSSPFNFRKACGKLTGMKIFRQEKINECENG
jgi:hypothetical protein